MKTTIIRAAQRIRHRVTGPGVIIAPEILVFPTRLDIQLMLDGLQLYDRSGMTGLRNSHYYRYVADRTAGDTGAVEHQLRDLVRVYREWRRYRHAPYGVSWRGWRSWDPRNWVSVIQAPNPHRVTAGDGKDDWLVLRPWELTGSGHLLAVLMHLGAWKVRCRIVERAGQRCGFDATGDILNKSYGESYLEHPNWPVLREDRGALSRLGQDLARQFLPHEHSHGNGVMYQGFQRLGLPGPRPVEKRAVEYGMHDVLSPNSVILDVGCNCGFFALHLAQFVAHVDAFDCDRSQIETGRAVQRHLSVGNCSLFVDSFNTFVGRRRYDAICSFAIHHWTGLKLCDYLEQLHRLLNPDGLVFFESHFLHQIDRGFDERLAASNNGRFDILRKVTTNDNRRFVLLRKRSNDFSPGDMAVV